MTTDLYLYLAIGALVFALLVFTLEWLCDKVKSFREKYGEHPE